jgi:hypothetical protein
LIRVQAVGGLGNQLFIWNLAHHLEELFKCDVKIYYPLGTGSDTKLELLPLAEICNHKISIVESFMFNRFLRILDKFTNRNRAISRSILGLLNIRQTDIPSDTIIFKSKKPKIVRGYFQSTKFVEDNLHLYIEELLAVTTSKASSSPIFNQILSCPQVLHIRRGDFTVNWERVGLLTTKYFQKIINPKFKTLIFTDANSKDSEFENIFKNSQVIGGDLADAWTSFSLLSFSKQLLLSNSTFSWWAGIIVLRRGGEVIAPTPWTRTAIYGDNYLEHSDFIKKPSDFLRNKP